MWPIAMTNIQLRATLLAVIHEAEMLCDRVEELERLGLEMYRRSIRRYNAEIKRLEEVQKKIEHAREMLKGGAK